MICPNDKNVADFLAAPVDKNNQRHEENSIYQKISINPRFKLNLKIPVQANIIFAKNKFSLISSPITENVFHPLPFLYSCRTKHLDQILSPPPPRCFLSFQMTDNQTVGTREPLIVPRGVADYIPVYFNLSPLRPCLYPLSNTAVSLWPSTCFRIIRKKSGFVYFRPEN